MYGVTPPKRIKVYHFELFVCCIREFLYATLERFGFYLVERYVLLQRFERILVYIEKCYALGWSFKKYLMPRMPVAEVASSMLVLLLDSEPTKATLMSLDKAASGFRNEPLVYFITALPSLYKSNTNYFTISLTASSRP
jgi:hypothetical protein